MNGKRDMQSDVTAVIGLLLIPALSIAVYPGLLLDYEIYKNVLLLTLAFFGIQGLYLLIKLGKTLAIRDLLPGLVSDQMLIGIDAIAFITWLFINDSMPIQDYQAIMMMILAAIVFNYVAGKSYLTARLSTYRK
jgi:hypothetical protein